VVGSLFDTSTRWTPIDSGVPAKALTCASSKQPIYFKAFKSDRDTWVLQFSILGRGHVMSKKVALLQGFNFDLNEAKTFPLVRGEDKIGNAVTASTAIISDFEGQDTLFVRREWEAVTDFKGKKLKGYQTPKYYLTWQSGSYPSMKAEDLPLNCSIELNK
jgi:hypothetical protein